GRVAAAQLEGQILDNLDSLLDRLSLVVVLLACIQEQHILRADHCLEALLPALAVLPRARVQAADDPHAATLVQVAPALLGQLVPRLNRRPVGLEHALARLVPPSQSLGRNAKAADRRARLNEPLLRLRPDPTDQLHPIDCASYLFHVSYLTLLTRPIRASHGDWLYSLHRDPLKMVTDCCSKIGRLA